MFFLISLLILSACIPTSPIIQTQEASKPEEPVVQLSATPLPTREAFGPGELVDYTVQDGDTVPALAARFNTTIEKIQANNPILPNTTTTLPPGLPLKIPIYYLPLWGSPYQIIPDYLFVNGPAQIPFDTVDFVAKTDGWLKNYRVYAYGGWRTGPEMVAYIGLSYSISPQVLLSLLEYQTQALTKPTPPGNVDSFALGYVEDF